MKYVQLNEIETILKGAINSSQSIELGKHEATRVGAIEMIHSSWQPSNDL